MADADEDIIRANAVDAEGDDETPDFRSFSALLRSKSGAVALPKRGEKDFEPHGTHAQADTLATSRAEMHSALSHVRVHRPDRHIRGEYVASTGLTRLHRPKSKLFLSIGRTDSRGITWLLPEEALYLLERGDLDVRWVHKSGEDVEEKNTEDARKGEERAEDAIKEEAESPHDGEVDGHISFSLQTAYAVYIGDTEKGISLERYSVYANLKRAGFAVFRGPAWYPHDHDKDVVDGRSLPARGLWSWLYELIHRGAILPSYGPLLSTGSHQSYSSIYRQIALLPRHDPTIPTARENALNLGNNHDTSIRVCYHVYKPRDGFRKSEPGPPDFRIAVVDARDSSNPNIEQIDGLLASMPYAPPLPAPENDNAGKMYSRLKHGYRNVVLAVVDQGIISYMRIADAGFGQEKLFEGAGRSKFGNKGGRGGGRGGRGRGRGRGGRGGAI